MIHIETNHKPRQLSSWREAPGTERDFDYILEGVVVRLNDDDDTVVVGYFQSWYDAEESA